MIEPGDLVLVDLAATSKWVTPFFGNPGEAEDAFTQMEQVAVVIKGMGSMYWIAPLLPSRPRSGDPGLEIQVDVNGQKTHMFLNPMHLQPVFVTSIHQTIDWLGTTRYQAVLDFITEWLKGSQ